MPHDFEGDVEAENIQRAWEASQPKVDETVK